MIMTMMNMSMQLMPEEDKKKKIAPQEYLSAEKKAEIAAYNKVARNAQLRGIVLFESNFFMLPQYAIEVAKEDTKQELSFDSKYRELDVDIEGGGATCEWTWHVAAVLKRKKNLFIQAKYVLFYDGISECDKESISMFMRKVGKFASYPYFRAHVHHVSGEANASLPILPTIST